MLRVACYVLHVACYMYLYLRFTIKIHVLTSWYLSQLAVTFARFFSSSAAFCRTVCNLLVSSVFSPEIKRNQRKLFRNDKEIEGLEDEFGSFIDRNKFSPNSTKNTFLFRPNTHTLYAGGSI